MGLHLFKYLLSFKFTPKLFNLFDPICMYPFKMKMRSHVM